MSVTQGRPTGHGQTGTSPRAQWGEAGGACPSRRTPRGARGVAKLAATSGRGNLASGEGDAGAS